jgi:hypothetical protein
MRSSILLLTLLASILLIVDIASNKVKPSTLSTGGDGVEPPVFYTGSKVKPPVILATGSKQKPPAIG